MTRKTQELLAALMGLLFIAVVLVLTVTGQDRIMRRPLYPPAASFSPADLADKIAWYRADTLSLSDTNTVTTWPDSFGNGHDATQPSEGLRPVFRTNIRNSLPVVRFDGSTFLRTTGSATFSNATLTMFVVSTSTATANGDSVSIYSGVIGSLYEMRVDGTSQLAWRPYNTGGGTTEATRAQVGSWMLFGGMRTTTDSIAYINGNSTTVSAVGTTQRTGGSQIFVGQFGLGFQYFSGDIAEIIIYNAALNTTDRQAVETYLRNKYALY